jgi:hypothetical protein
LVEFQIVTDTDNKKKSIVDLGNCSVLCPSYFCKEDAILLGIVRKEGHISFVKERILIDNEFIKIANKGRKPEKRFRFAGNCVKNACKHWKGYKCTLIDGIISNTLSKNTTTKLPDCSIRQECRWYRQCGEMACSICPQIIYTISEE